LRERLSRGLPEYMLPAAYVLLPALPVTAHGKLDRRALPVPDADAAPAVGHVPPTGPVETALAGIWSEALSVPNVGVRDNFFAIGGDSILSLQVVSRARQAGLALSTKDLFRHQTIAELATVVREVGPAADQTPVVGDVPLTPIQRWFFETGPANPHHF